MTPAREPSRSGVGLVAPIPGRRASVAEARAVAGYAIPQLPVIPVPDPCDGVVHALILLATWVSVVAGPTDSDPIQVGLRYTHGVWVSVGPRSMYTFPPGAEELPPVEAAFSPNDYPTGLLTTEVRGHVTWAKEPSPALSCADLGIPDGRGAVDFPTREIGNIQWMERGLVIEVAGPYSSGQLKAIVADITCTD